MEQPKLLRYSKILKPGREFSGKTFLVTGANTGIGYAAAKLFASKGAEVIMVCRIRVKALLAAEQIRSEYEYERRKDSDAMPTEDLKLTPMDLDLSSLDSALTFINKFKQNYTKLDVMILNAGIAGVKKIITGDGMETHFQVNYLTHFLMCLHMIPLLEESKGVVLSVSSEAHRVLAKFKLGNFQGEKTYGRFLAYGNSKLFQMMASFSFERRLSHRNIHFVTMHPGHVTDTAIGNHITDMSILYLLRQCLYAVDGIESSVAAKDIYEILRQKDEYKSEVYYNRRELGEASQDSRDVVKQEQLWSYSIKLLENYLPVNMPPELLPEMNTKY
ncbi:WW domain-containing oxidoreductase-like [Antedon mediterranea]|uniref:WW domain-containing oxidoreductase-like n=1 Tax=Antedon mediterranea TaxID=105859 RepID=UPI003AF60542